MTREERRHEILEDLRRMAEQLASSRAPLSFADVEAYFQKAEELPLADRSLEEAAGLLQRA
jgi:hypothetical protein